MKRLTVATCLFGLMALTGSIVAQAQDTKPVNFTVRIENVSGSNTQIYSSVGIDGIPVGSTVRRPAMPGEAFDFVIKAKAGDHLSFASMYGQSNDTFVGTNETGIALYDASGKAISGDVSDQVSLWDAGTEVNEPLGKGPNQAPRQGSPDAGTPENGTVQPTAFGGDWPASVADLTKVTLTPQTGDQILVHFENATAKAPVPTPFSPLAYVVHSADQTGVFFKTGEKDRGLGLEHVAEAGNPEDLGAAVAGSAVMNVGLSPGVFVIHSDKQVAPIFKTGEKDRGQGLEAQAEDGSPVALGDA
ncbi:MAG: spondin domain-containing protein, partial [Anaerolineae bacterium]|nr:spondin domain-containing protein [Anaerolineae bacterium]